MKNKLIYLLLLFLIGVATFQACKKDEDIAGTNDNITNTSTAHLRYAGNNCCNDLTMECGILKFSSWTQYQQVYECLESEVDRYVDEFDSLYSGLSDSLFNVYADSLGYDEDEPLLSFTSCMGFRSYRDSLDELEADWIAGAMDSVNDPYKNAISPDDIFNTLLSSNRAYIVDTVLYWFALDGTQYSITNWDCEMFYELQGDPEKAMIRFANIQVVQPWQWSTCQSYYHNSGLNEYIFGQFKYYWDHYWKGSDNHTVIMGKIRSYKKKSGSAGWKKYRTSLDLDVDGTRYLNWCEGTDNYSAERNKRAKKLSCKKHHWLFLDVFHENANENTCTFTCKDPMYTNTNTF